MKRITCTSALVFSLLLGVARLADLVWNTDAETGFLRFGSIVPRYLLLLAGLLLILYAAHAVPFGQACGVRSDDEAWMRGANPLLLPLAFCSELYGFLFLLGRFFGVPIQTTSSHHAMDNLQLYNLRLFADGARAALFVVFGLWCLLLFYENFIHTPCGRWMLTLGTLSSTVFYLHTVLRFIERPSSLYRTIPAVDILSALSALLFVTALLRALYLPDSLHAARILCRSGLLAFFLCTCLALPQTMWQYHKGNDTLVSLILAFGLGFLGIIGAICAHCAANVPEEPEA